MMLFNFFAMAPSSSQSGGKADFSFIIVLVLIFAVFYFLIIMPQKKKQKQHQEKVNELKKGDKVITSGGIHGIITNTKNDSVIIKVADNVKIEVNKVNISQILKETSENGQTQSQD